MKISPQSEFPLFSHSVGALPIPTCHLQHLLLQLCSPPNPPIRCQSLQLQWNHLSGDPETYLVKSNHFPATLTHSEKLNDGAPSFLKHMLSWPPEHQLSTSFSTSTSQLGALLGPSNLTWKKLDFSSKIQDIMNLVLPIFHFGFHHPDLDHQYLLPPAISLQITPIIF